MAAAIPPKTSEFKPAPPVEGSPLLEPKIADELLAFVDNRNQAQQEEQEGEIHGLRIIHAWLLLILTVVWVIVIWVVVLLQGFGQWFFPIPDFLKDWVYLSFKLSDSVMIAFMTSTTTTVLGLYGIAAYWLYGKPKDQKAAVKKVKK